MKKLMSLGLLVVLVSIFFTPVAQARDYNILNGDITFTIDSGKLWVEQIPFLDDYAFDNAFTNILIYGNSQTTDNTILINTPRQDDYIVNVTFSNVLISASGIPCDIMPGSKVNLFLATGTSNDLRTTEVECPALRASLGGWATELTIRGKGTLVAVGGAGGAGIGSGSFYMPGAFELGGGTITIQDAAVVKAYGGYYAAAIGSGDRVDSETWAGGNITISNNATVYAQGGTGGAGIGGGFDSESATISIGPSNKVFAASDGTRPAIDDADETLGGDGYVIMLNYSTQKTAGKLTKILYRRSYSWLTLTSFAPSIDYQSIAFSLAATNTYRVRCDNISQEHDAEDDFLLVTTGLEVFDNVDSSGHVFVTFDMQGGEGGSTDVNATYGLAMPAAIAPTNSNTYLSFGGYYLETNSITKYYNADMTSARTCDQLDDFILYAQWLDSRVWDGTSRTYDWYTNKFSPFTIRTASQLAGFAAIVNGTAPGLTNTFSGQVVILAENLNLADYKWTPIGNYVEASDLFQGTFNGGSKTLTGLYISTNALCQGLFGYIGSTSVISNLTVDASITGGNYVGAICGFNNGGTLQNCVVSNTVTGDTYVGGISGLNKGLLQGCASYATVQGNQYVGGLVGQNYGGKIRNSTVSGPVTGTGNSSQVGGIAGQNYGTVQNAIFTSIATGLDDYARVGGIAGYNPGQINSCLMLGSLAFDYWNPYVGGIAGEHSSGSSVTNAYFHTSAGVSKGLGYAGGANTAVGSFSTLAGAVTATDGTSLLYGDQLHLALNRGVYTLNGDNQLLWWTTATNAYPSLTTNRPPYTLSTPLTVPFSWLATYYPGQQANFETIAQYPGTNPYLVWESYLAGLVPTNATSTFTADITLTNETPYVTWSPNDTSRLYTVQGKALLSDSSWGATNSASRFFKVTVEMP